MTRTKTNNIKMTEVLGYFNLSECSDRKKITNYLNELATDCKINWTQEDYDTIKIIDLDLDEQDVEDITSFLSDYDVIQEVGKEDDDYRDGFDDYGDDYEDFGYGDSNV